MTPRRSVRTAAGALVLVAALLLFCFSLLAVFRAPTFLLWQVSILATEAGHVIAPVGLVFLAGWRFSRLTRAAAVLAACATILLLTPVLRAARVAGGVNVVDLYFSSQPRIEPVRHIYSAADGSALVMDVYAAQGVTSPAPLIVMIHGGSWHGGGPGDLPPLNSRLASHGYTVAAVSYRLAPEHRFPAQLEDVRAALAWLKARAEAMNLDTTRVAFIGRSAGGHLAALAALTIQDAGVRGAVSLYGVNDLEWGYAHPAPPRVHDSRRILREFLGGTPESMPDTYREASPITYAASAPPILMVHGARDELVNVEHARRLAASLSQSGRTHEYIELPWATHGCDFIFRGPCGQITTRAIERFLASQFDGASGSDAGQRL